jgi:hypothetical protein
MTWVSSAHHIFCIEHLLSELWDGQSTVLLGAARGQWREACHEEVQTGEGDQVDGDLTEVAIELPRETQAASHTAHGC